jgi:glycosyltransferase involved in cell wall biosynthesis
MIGVLVPANNEEDCIGACLASVAQAARAPALGGETVVTVVALDRCTDATADIVLSNGVLAVTVDAGNVGRARAAAAARLIGLGARWIACTDADSRVPADWLSSQLAYGCDAFCGMVTVADWLDYAPAVRRLFLRNHRGVGDHGHIHGANLGFCTRLYRHCGGFAPLAAHEDVALVAAFVEAGACIARKRTPTVVTSSRRRSRATGGFADYLRSLERYLEARAGERHGQPRGKRSDTRRQVP